MDNMDKYLGKMLDNRYEILEVLGSGGMAVVYKALCHRLKRHVAVKILRDDLAVDPEFRRRFQTESQAVAMLSHPNIVTVYDVSRSGDSEYIVMELIEGLSLKQYMNKKGALAWKEALHFAVQIAGALKHAHGRGIVHRDIKPHNIMIVKDGNIKVADFGIARLQDSQHTVTQMTLGSVHYISPEQAKGENVDARTDIYSLGVVMYEMLTGRLPFRGESAVAVAVAHINSTPMPPRGINPSIPSGLESITMNAMNPDINERYESAEALLLDLEEFRKTQAAIDSGALSVSERDGLQLDLGDDKYVVRRNVKPVSRTGEMEEEDYRRRRSRSKKVSMLSGLACVLVFIVVVFVFLWNFWLGELFSEPQRRNVPSFVGDIAKEVVENREMTKIYEFTVIEEPSNEDEGTIIAQSPESGKSLMVTKEKIEVELRVSAGTVYNKVPDLVNLEYREAERMLTELGYIAEIEVIASDTITKDYVISTEPVADTELISGSTVKLYMSGGPEIVTVLMPDLVGMLQNTAVQTLENRKLSLGGVSEIQDNRAKGTVVWQSIEPNTEIEEHEKVYIQISSGPAPSPTPTPTVTVTATPTPTATDNTGDEDENTTPDAVAAVQPDVE